MLTKESKETATALYTLQTIGAIASIHPTLALPIVQQLCLLLAGPPSSDNEEEEGEDQDEEMKDSEEKEREEEKEKEETEEESILREGFRYNLLLSVCIFLVNFYFFHIFSF